jgi:hypothetical protein
MKTEIFLQGALDRPNQIESLQQIRFFAPPLFAPHGLSCTINSGRAQG